MPIIACIAVTIFPIRYKYKNATYLFKLATKRLIAAFTLLNWRWMNYVFAGIEIEKQSTINSNVYMLAFEIAHALHNKGVHDL